ncbi:hypothetical protein ACE193_15860 [Bernardetia sp. OM2101]|uniref:hypothetical protein n=1 Tax=Bernardetia sp. OM2101 TaxID=3344876 RepID=UPI0035CF8AAC
MNKITQQLKNDYSRIYQKLESHFERIHFTRKANYYTAYFADFLDKIETKAKDLERILKVTHIQITEIIDKKENKATNTEVLCYYFKEVQKLELLIDTQKEELKSLQKSMREYWF